MKAWFVLLILTLSMSCFGSSKVYDIEKSCASFSRSDEITVENGTVNGCNLRIICDKADNVKVSVLYKCTENKGFYSFGSSIPGFLTTITSVSVVDQYVLITTLDKSIEDSSFQSRLLKGSVVGSTETELKKEHNKLLKLEPITSGKPLLRTFSQAKCTKLNVRLSNLGCFTSVLNKF